MRLQIRIACCVLLFTLSLAFKYGRSVYDTQISKTLPYINHDRSFNGNLYSSQFQRSSALAESANRVLELGDWSVNVVRNLAMQVALNNPSNTSDAFQATNLPVLAAVERIKGFKEEVIDLNSITPQLTRVELAVLLTTISLSALSPFFLDIEVIEVLVPSLAALSASVGISAEYLGKVAVSEGKEYAALAIIAAAQAETLLASAERAKSVLPLCVGTSTLASAFSLVAQTLISESAEKYGLRLMNEVCLIFPLIAGEEELELRVRVRASVWIRIRICNCKTNTFSI
jgi:hypothetical protein